MSLQETNPIVFRYIQHGIKGVALHLEKKEYTPYYYDQAIIWGLEKVDLALLEVLKPHIDPTREDLDILLLAIKNNNCELIHFLLPLFDPQKHKTNALVTAIHEGASPSIAKLLLPFCDFEKEGPDLLAHVAYHATQNEFENDYARIAAVREYNSSWAEFRQGYLELIPVILPHINLQDTLDLLIEDENPIEKILLKVKAEMEQNELHGHTLSVLKSRKTRL